MFWWQRSLAPSSNSSGVSAQSMHAKLRSGVLLYMLMQEWYVFGMLGPFFIDLVASGKDASGKVH